MINIIVYGIPLKYPKEKLEGLIDELNGITRLTLGTHYPGSAVFFPKDLCGTGLGQEITVFIYHSNTLIINDSIVKNLRERCAHTLRSKFKAALIQVTSIEIDSKKELTLSPDIIVSDADTHKCPICGFEMKRINNGDLFKCINCEERKTECIN